MRRVLLPLAALVAAAGLVLGAELSRFVIGFGAAMAGCPDAGREACEHRQLVAYELNRAVAVAAALAGCVALVWPHQPARRRVQLVAVAAGVMLASFWLAAIAIEN